MYKHILLPTDGSKLSIKAVKQGVRLAKSLRAKVTAIHVMPEYQMVMDETFATASIVSFQQQFDEESKKRAKKILERAKTEAAAAKVACLGVVVTSRAPYDAIIRQAKKSRCDLIVMASHGRKGLSSLLLGSETAKVLTHSKIPVLVVR
jgi:nucleotide-binding universal stress UspA family protein